MNPEDLQKEIAGIVMTLRVVVVLGSMFAAWSVHRLCVIWGLL